jgi:hypothetical protein
MALCPLGSACLAHALAHGGAVSASGDGAHDHSDHSDHSTPAETSIPDGCNAIQHCAPSAWTAEVRVVVIAFDGAAIRFPPPGAELADGLDYDPAVPPPRHLS